jgi:hypothetical protein
MSSGEDWDKTGDSANTARNRRSQALTDFANTSSRVVQTAAVILEEEIAAGMAAAKEVSAQMANAVQHADLTQSDYTQIIECFRHDAHDAVDVLVTLLKTAAEGLVGVAGASGRNRASSPVEPGASKKTAQRPVSKKKK